jgi:hypothetical protein
VRQPGDIRRPEDVRRARNSQGLRPGDGVPDTRLAPYRNTVRLTRRGRIVVAVMLTAASLSLVVLAWLAIAAMAAQAADGGRSPGAVYQNLTSIVVPRPDPVSRSPRRASPVPTRVSPCGRSSTSTRFPAPASSRPAPWVPRG